MVKIRRLIPEFKGFGMVRGSHFTACEYNLCKEWFAAFRKPGANYSDAPSGCKYTFISQSLRVVRSTRRT